jgi:hypothetical protein
MQHTTATEIRLHMAEGDRRLGAISCAFHDKFVNPILAAMIWRMHCYEIKQAGQRLLTYTPW